MLQREEDLAAVLRALGTSMGTIEEQTPVEPFTHTAYYEKEMGQNLMRAFVLFAPLVEREALPGIKLAANEIEGSFSLAGSRTINIDPGYIALEHVILATTKGYAHRVYLGSGIHADLTLIYSNNTYRALEWTYPDYREEKTILMFVRWREQLKKVLKCRKA